MGCGLISHQYYGFEPLYSMKTILYVSQVTDEVGIEKIKEENEMIIMKAFGIEYEKFFPQNHQCEK